MSMFFFSSRRRHTRSLCDWSSDVCSSDLRGVCQNRSVFLVISHAFCLFFNRLVMTLFDPTMTRKRRSEERRVGKECRKRWKACNKKKKEQSEVIAIRVEELRVINMI